jgi:hypothetical protein
VLEQRKTILKVLLSCVSSQKNKFTELEKRKYRNGFFTELCLTYALMLQNQSGRGGDALQHLKAKAAWGM